MACENGETRDDVGDAIEVTREYDGRMTKEEKGVALIYLTHPLNETPDV